MAGPPFVIPGSVPRLPADVASKVRSCVRMVDVSPSRVSVRGATTRKHVHFLVVYQSIPD